MIIVGNISLGIIGYYANYYAYYAPNFLEKGILYRQMDVVLRDMKFKCKNITIMGDFNCHFGQDAH